MEQNIDIQVDPYIEAGNVIYPSFHLSLQPGMIIGIYTDVSKIHTLMQWFMKRDDTYTFFVKARYMSDSQRASISSSF